MLTIMEPWRGDGKVHGNAKAQQVMVNELGACMDGGAKEVKQSPRQRYNIMFVFTGHE